MKLRVLGALASLVTMTVANAHVVCTAVSDAGTGKVLIQQGDCKTRVTPASTFKVALSLMGYDSGFLKDEHAPALPFREGYIEWGFNPRQPADPARWMKDSVVWYSQQITRSLGKERFADYTRRFQFGNADVSGDAKRDGLTLSWVSSSLRISPLEQLSFLRKIVNRQLGVSQHAYDMTSEITKIAQAPTGWELHGKTGSGSPRDADGEPDSAHAWGWFVGWISKGQHTYVFARLIQDDGQPQTVGAGIRAREAFISELPALLEKLPQ